MELNRLNVILVEKKRASKWLAETLGKNVKCRCKRVTCFNKKANIICGQITQLIKIF